MTCSVVPLAEPAITHKNKNKMTGRTYTSNLTTTNSDQSQETIRCCEYNKLSFETQIQFSRSHIVPVLLACSWLTAVNCHLKPLSDCQFLCRNLVYQRIFFLQKNLKISGPTCLVLLLAQFSNAQYNPCTNYPESLCDLPNEQISARNYSFSKTKRCK